MHHISYPLRRFFPSNYAYVRENPLKGWDSFGLSPADVQNIINTFNNTVNQMTRDGVRLSSPFWNNEARDFGKLTHNLIGNSKILNCGEQAEYMNNVLRNKKYDANWYFLVDEGTGHAWGLAIASDPGDPAIYYDPRGNTIGTGQPCPTCQPWFGPTSYGPDNPPPVPPPPRSK